MRGLVSEELMMLVRPRMRVPGQSVAVKVSTIPQRL